MSVNKAIPFSTLFATLTILLLLPACSFEKDAVPAQAPTASQPFAAESKAASISSEVQPSEAEPEPAEPPDTLRAREILSGMTTQEKIAQMFFVHFQDADSAELARQYGFGGYLLFASNFEGMSKEDVTNRIAQCQDASKIKLLIGVDEEGGGVNRVSVHPRLHPAPFKSPKTLAASGGLELIKSDAAEKSALLKSLGINLNLAPVCDVSTNTNDFIHYRTLGQNAEATAAYVESVVNVMNEENIGSALKHFPGYGNNIDTHTGIAYDKRSYDTFLNEDFLPFIAGIQAGAGAVLVSHNIVECMDAENPASLSPEVHRILREDLGFDGVIMTDDLQMGAITQFAGSGGAAVSAVLAGNDLLCCSDFLTQMKAVADAVESGVIGESAIDASVTRILKWKLKLGIIQ